MSEIQGVKSVNEIAEDDDKSLVSTTSDKSVACQQSNEEDHQERELQNAQEASAETMRALEDIGKTLDIQQHESKDQTPKRDEVVGRSVGECRNILPVLVEHLRSALELSADSSNRSITSADSLVHDPLSRYNPQYEAQSKPPLSLRTMDLNLFEDLLVIDIKTALVRLQEILRRVNGDALSRYSSTLEPSDRLNLLQLISNLVANLKNAKMEDSPQQPPNPIPMVVKKKQSSKRRDRHTIGVSSEELARARKWLEERGTGISLVSQRLSLAPQTIQLENSTFIKEEMKEKAFESARACDKHMKDAINQQQSLHSKSKDIEVSSVSGKHESKEAKVMNGTSVVEKFHEALDVTESSTFNNKCNKFSAKKFKIKRANTIDIPNYLKLQAQKSQSTSPGLKKPIDISDRLSWNASQASHIIPSFEPKTENDRKFLALINRNNDTSGNTIVNQPFKSFNYRQTSSVADKNWKSRFSNIKTTFDKSSSPISADEPLQRSNRDNGKESFTKDREKDEVFLASMRFNKPQEPSSGPPRNISSKKLPIFNHAATSPFQKIQHLQRTTYKEPEKPLSSCYLPACASSGMLKAKMKMFNQESSAESTPSLSSLLMKPTERTNVHRKAEKLLKGGELNNGMIKQRNASVHHDGYDKSRRYTMFNNNDNVKINIPDVQRRQSVAVQTNNDLIQVNNVENDQHDSSMIPRQICLHPSPTYQPLVPKMFYSEHDYSIYVPPKPAPKELECFGDSSMSDKKYWSHDSINGDQATDDDTSDHSFLDQNIENQDISDNRVITRYTSAIGTMEESPSLSPTLSAQHSTPVLSPLYHQETIVATPQPVILHNDVQRHNMLQQSLIRHFQHQNDEQKKCNQVLNISQKYPSIQCSQDKNFLPIVHPMQSFNDREAHEPVIESHNTQEKINIFESKSHNINRNKPEPLVLSTHQFTSPPLPKINVVSPPHIQPLGITSAQAATPILRKYSTNPIDSSDEYLVSCANKPHRSIVLSKSESWHQLALSKNHLQVPQAAHPPHKPPKISSQTSKHNEPLSDTFKKMEKVQSYFVNDQKHRESKTRRSFSPKQTQGLLSRSHTMPLIFDDASEVDKAFDSLFEETTRDNRL